MFWRWPKDRTNEHITPKKEKQLSKCLQQSYSPKKKQNSRIAPLPKAVAHVVIVTITIQCVGININQSHQPTGGIMTICQTDGMVDGDAQKPNVVAPYSTVYAVHSFDGRSGYEESVGLLFLWWKGAEKEKAVLS